MIFLEYVGSRASLSAKNKEMSYDISLFFAEREALEPTYSRNIIKLQIINNQALFGVHSKSKSF
jgi:hypothetical protein